MPAALVAARASVISGSRSAIPPTQEHRNWPILGCTRDEVITPSG
jgi:hypothetical protein